VWQAARRLAVATYYNTRALPRSELFGMTSQLRRSAVSIAANLAEGAGRGTNRDFARFVRIAAGSASEYETHVLVSSDVGLMPSDVASDLLAEVASIKRMLHKLETSIADKSGSGG
jgi:four helix bundle protein